MPVDAKLRLNAAFSIIDSISTSYIWTHPPNENITQEPDDDLGKCGKFITWILHVFILHGCTASNFIICSSAVTVHLQCNVGSCAVATAEQPRVSNSDSC